MAISGLSTSEINKIEAARNVDPRPEFYNAGVGASVPVSDDFLAVLALASSGAKQKAANFFQLLNIPLNADIIAGVLYAEAVAMDALEAQAQLLQYEAALLAHTEFKDSGLGEPRFSAATETLMLMNDASLGLDRHIHRRAALFHQVAVGAELERVFVGVDSGVTPDRKRQAMSWVACLSVPVTLV